MSRNKSKLPKRDRIAQLRFSIIGSLLSAPMSKGKLKEKLQALAAQTWRHHETGEEIKFGLSTIERWYYSAHKSDDPVEQLRPKLRSTIGSFPSMKEGTITALKQQYKEHPG